MEQTYFQIQLDSAINEAERLVKTLYAVKTDYADKRMEEALIKSVTAARISESVALKTRALPAYTGHPQAEVMVQKALEEAVPIEMGFTEKDDTPLECRHYYCSASGEKEMTEVYIVPREEFESWLAMEKNPEKLRKKLSENLPETAGK